MNRALLLAIALAGCHDGAPQGNRSDSAPPPAPPATTRESFTHAMESNDRQLSLLRSDAKSRAGAKACRGRLAVIRKNTDDAAAVKWKDSASEQEELEREFRMFARLLDELEREDWKDDAAMDNYKRVELACNRCHMKFQDER